MIHLITGGSGSGKSAYAEDWLKNKTQSGELLYIATMQPFGEEAKKRIARHHKLRAGKGFTTIECYKNLEQSGKRSEGILLECMSNLTANELFNEDGRLNDRKEIREKILRGVTHLAGLTDQLVIVTNEVTADLQDYSRETKIYQCLLGEINQRLAQMADLVTEVVYGIPIVVKKSEKDME